MIEAVLLDIEGTIIDNGDVIVGAPETLSRLRNLGINVRLVSNISSRPPSAILSELHDNGFSNLTVNEIRTAATAAVLWLSERGATYTDLLLPTDVAHLFPASMLDRENPDVVVIGDVGSGFSYENMNAALSLLKNGAKMLALQRNLIWSSNEGPRLDCGAFVAALEAATGMKAELAGKPSALFFRAALDELGTAAENTLIIGDDQSTDMVGAHAIGAIGIMVETGKGHRKDDRLPAPTYILPNVCHVPELIDKLNQSQPRPELHGSGGSREAEA